jgi:hypothetical protein
MPNREIFVRNRERRFVLGWKKLGLEQRLGSRIVTYADDGGWGPQWLAQRFALSFSTQGAGVTGLVQKDSGIRGAIIKRF